MMKMNTNRTSSLAGSLKCRPGVVAAMGRLATPPPPPLPPSLLPLLLRRRQCGVCVRASLRSSTVASASPLVAAAAAVVEVAAARHCIRSSSSGGPCGSRTITGRPKANKRCVAASASLDADAPVASSSSSSSTASAASAGRSGVAQAGAITFAGGNGTAASTAAAPAAATTGAAAAASAAGAGPRSFDPQLPPAASGVADLGALDAADATDARAQRAEDWGYVRLGRRFPEGVPPAALAEEVLSEEHFKLDARQALAGLVSGAALIAAACAWQAYMQGICPLWQRLACWLAAGTGYRALFAAAADCARFAFWPARPALQDAVGAALMAPALLPYEGWRLQAFNHMLRPNMLEEDSPLWHPLTLEQFARMPNWRRALARVLTATPLRFAARALAGWAAAWDALDLRRHPPPQRRHVALSWLPPALFAGGALPALLASGGVERLVGWWLAPWLVFHAWQGLFAVATTTAPHIPFVEEGFEYDHGQAIVNGCVTLALPSWLERLLGAPNLPLPAALSLSVPWYNRRAAQEALDARLGPYLTYGDALSPRLLLNLSTRCSVYDAAQRRYVSFDEAEAAAVGSGVAAAAEPAAA